MGLPNTSGRMISGYHYVYSHLFIFIATHLSKVNIQSNNDSLCCVGCSLLIISSSLFAILTGGQRSPWCEVVSLLKFAFITSSIGSIGTTAVCTLSDKCYIWSAVKKKSVIVAIFYNIIFLLLQLAVIIIFSFLYFLSLGLCRSQFFVLQLYSVGRYPCKNVVYAWILLWSLLKYFESGFPDSIVVVALSKLLQTTPRDLHNGKFNVQA